MVGIHRYTNQIKSTLTEKWGTWIGYAVLLITYVWYVIQQVANYPHANDDIRAFLKQFQDYQTGKYSGLGDYLFSLTNWPHPNILVRLWSVVSYEVTGEINFLWIQLSGHLMILTLGFFLIWDSGYKFKWPSLFIALLISIPATNIFTWNVALMGFVPNCLLAYLIYRSYKRRKWAWTATLSLIATFITGVGFLITLPILFMVVINSGVREYRDLLLLGGIFVFNFVLFSTISLDWQFSRPNSEDSDLGAFQVLQSLTFIPSYISIALNRFYFLSATQGFIVGMILLITYLYLFISHWRSKQLIDNLVPHLLCLYVLGLAMVAGMVRHEGGDLIQFVPPRYQYYSTVFLISVGLLLMKQAKSMNSRIPKLILLFCILHFTYVQIKPLKAFRRSVDRGLKENRFASKLAEGGYSEKFLNPLILDGYYKPDLARLNPQTELKDIIAPEDLPTVEGSPIFLDKLSGNSWYSYCSFKIKKKDLLNKEYTWILSLGDSLYLSNSPGKHQILKRRDNFGLIERKTLGEKAIFYGVLCEGRIYPVIAKNAP